MSLWWQKRPRTCEPLHKGIRGTWTTQTELELRVYLTFPFSTKTYPPYLSCHLLFSHLQLIFQDLSTLCYKASIPTTLICSTHSLLGWTTIVHLRSCFAFYSTDSKGITSFWVNFHIQQAFILSLVWRLQAMETLTKTEKLAMTRKSKNFKKKTREGGQGKVTNWLNDMEKIKIAFQLIRNTNVIQHST